MFEIFGVIVYGGIAAIILLGLLGLTVIVAMAAGLHRPIVEIRDDEVPPGQQRRFRIACRQAPSASDWTPRPSL